VGGIGGGGDGADLRECGTRLVGLGEREDAPLDVVFGGKGVYVYVIVTCSDDDAVVGGCDGKGLWVVVVVVVVVWEEASWRGLKREKTWLERGSMRWMAPFQEVVRRMGDGERYVTVFLDAWDCLNVETKRSVSRSMRCNLPFKQTTAAALEFELDAPTSRIGLFVSITLLIPSLISYKRKQLSHEAARNDSSEIGLTFEIVSLALLLLVSRYLRLSL
jgi:hypothetical protein